MLLCTPFEDDVFKAFRPSNFDFGAVRSMSFHSGDPGELGTNNLISGIPPVTFAYNTLTNTFELFAKFASTPVYVNDTIDRFSFDSVDIIQITTSAPVADTISWVLIYEENQPQRPVCRIPLVNPITTIISQPAEIPFGGLNLSFQNFGREAARNTIRHICGGSQYTLPSTLDIGLFEALTINSYTNELTMPISRRVTINFSDLDWSLPSGSPRKIRYTQQLSFGTFSTSFSIGGLALMRENTTNASQFYFIKVYDPPLLVTAGDEILLLPNSLSLSLD